MKFFHIHWYQEAGLTCSSASGKTGWSVVFRCRCGNQKLEKRT
jgi:hypothetical protein